MPELPDPQVDDHGDDHYPAGSIPAGGWPQSVLQGCQAAWGTVLQWRNQLDSLQNPRTSQPASTARMLRLAQCIRAHGFPDYPDPGADGQTQAPVPPGFDKPDLSPAARAAIQACQSASP